MVAARAAAVTLCLLGAGLGLVFTVLTLYCGALSVEANEPGQPRHEARCESSLHPLGPLSLGVGLVAAWAAWTGRGWIGAVLGVPLLVISGLFVFSAGVFGIGAAILILAGGLLGLRRQKSAALPVPSAGD